MTTSAPPSSSLKVLCFSLGLFLIANFLVAPWSPNSPRMLDFLCLGFALYTILRAFRVRVAPSMLLLLLMPCGFGLFVLIGFSIGDSALAFVSGRIILYTLAIPAIGLLLRIENGWYLFCLGGAFGGVLIGLIGAFQKVDLAPVFHLLAPVDAPAVWVAGEIRTPSIFGHPNGFSQVATLAAAMAMSLTWYRKNIGLGLVLFFVITALAYFSTSTRAGLLVALVILLFSLAFHPNTATRRTFFLYFPGVVLIAILLAPGLLGQRWQLYSDANLGLIDNVRLRFDSYVASFEGILLNPLGLGFQGRLNHIQSVTGLSGASHNGFLSFGLTFGLLPFVLLLTLLVRNLFVQRRAISVIFFLAILLLSFAEDSIFLPTFILSLLICLFANGRFFVTDPGGSVTHRPAPVSHGFRGAEGR